MAITIRTKNIEAHAVEEMDVTDEFGPPLGERVVFVGRMDYHANGRRAVVLSACVAEDSVQTA